MHTVTACDKRKFSYLVLFHLFQGLGNNKANFPCTYRLWVEIRDIRSRFKLTNYVYLYQGIRNLGFYISRLLKRNCCTSPNFILDTQYPRYDYRASFAYLGVLFNCIMKMPGLIHLTKQSLT